MKKAVITLLVALLALGVIGCSSSPPPGVEKTDAHAPKGETPAPKVEVPAPKIYGVGDTVVVNGKYAVTLLGVTETKDRNQFSDKTPAQVLIIDYLYENIAENTEDIYISEMNFKFIDEGGNMCATYPVGGIYGPEHTPVGAKTLTSMTIGTVETSEQLAVNYYDNMFNSKPTIEFKVTVGTAVEPRLEGEVPTYKDAYSIGDVIEVKTAKGNYRLSIDSIKRTEQRNQFADKKPMEVYLIEYSYSNVNLDDDLFISEMDFRVVDGNGVMAFTYPGNVVKHAQSTVKGAKCTAQMVFGTHTRGDVLILGFTDNMFSDLADFVVVLENINDK